MLQFLVLAAAGGLALAVPADNSSLGVRSTAAAAITENRSISVAAVGADGPLAVALDVPPRQSRIVVRPPVRQVEEAGAAPAAQGLGSDAQGSAVSPVSVPVPAAVRANSVPGRLPGTITFPNERLQQADDRVDIEQDGSSWESLYDGCGYTKNCLGIPPDCDQSRNCRAIVTAQWIKQGINSALHFRMRASDSKWVAVGLGDSPLMYGTAVLECVDDPVGTISAYLSYTPPDKRGCVRVSKQDPLGTTLKNSKSMNGDIFCEVFRVNDSRVNGKEYNLGVTPYFIQLASGQSIKNDGTGISYHGGTNRNAAVRSTVLTDYQVLGSVNNWPMRLHGALMVLAWMFAATAGSMAARYFKAAWGKATICGKAMWFAWHRLLMILTVSLHLIAFVAALIYLQGWSSSSGTHGILGGVTTALAVLQGAGGLFRPAPDHKYRAIFNWVHRCQGFATHVLAIITIFFAVGLPNARLPSYSYYILGAFAISVVILHAVHSLTEVKSYYFLIVVFGTAVYAITMMILVVIGPEH